jgi:hypothetical protein
MMLCVSFVKIIKEAHTADELAKEGISEIIDLRTVSSDGLRF